MASDSVSTLAAIYFVVFIDYFQLTFIVPFLAPLVEALPNGSVSMIVIAETLNFAGSAVGQPLLGSLSDHFGRRRVLLISMLGSTISCALLGLASRIWMVLVARAVNGISGGSLAMALSYMADISDDKQLQVRNPRICAAVMLGACVGPLSGSLLYSLWGIQVACFVAAGINCLTVLFILFFLQEASMPSVQSGSEQSSSEDVEGCPDDKPADPEVVEQLPLAVWFLCMARGLQGPMQAVFSTFTNSYIEEQLFGGDEHAGTVFFQMTLTVSSAVAFVLLVFFYKPIVTCIGLRALVLLALIAGVSGGLLNAVVFPSAPWLFTLGYTLWVNAFQIFTPAMTTLIAQLAPSSKVGLANGLAAGFNSVAVAISPPALWPLYRVEPAGVFFLLAGLFVPLAAIVCTVSYIPLQQASKTLPKSCA